MRVLFLSQIYSDCASGGETVAAWEMSNALAERGVEIFVVTPFVKVKGKYHRNIKVYKIPFCHRETLNFTPEDSLKAFFWSLPIIFLKRIDIVHLASTHGPSAFARFKIRPFVETADLLWDYDDPNFKEDLAFDRQRKYQEAEIEPVKLSFLERVFRKFTFYFYKIFKLNEPLPRSVDLYACREEALIDYLKSNNYHSQVVLVSFGVDINKFNPRLKPAFDKKGKFIFLFVGRISKRKGVETLLKAFNKFSHQYNNVELLLIGSGVNEYFLNLAENNKKIKFLGEKVGDELISYFATADILVAPTLSKFAGLFKVAVEAMACGKPVIVNQAYDTDKIKEKIGFFVPAKDVDKLAQVMEYALNHPQILKEMGQTAREYVVKNNSWQVNAERLIKAYKNILINKNPP